MSNEISPAGTAPAPSQPGPLARARAWLAAHPKVRTAAVALLSALATAVLTRWLPAEVVERTVEVLVPVAVPVPLGADPVGPIDYEGMAFQACDHEHSPDGAQKQFQAARWPTDRITYGIDYGSIRGISPPVSEASVREAARRATGWWSEHLQIEFAEVGFGDAMIPIRFERIDGPGGTLAQAYLADGTMRAKPLTMDVSERWNASGPAANQVSMPGVLCHEIGHSLGCGHDAPSAPAVMRPTYSSAIPREQPRDIDRMAQLGYKRRPAVPPAPADVLTFPIQARTDEVVEALKKAGFTVTKP